MAHLPPADAKAALSPTGHTLMSPTSDGSGVDISSMTCELPSSRGRAPSAASSRISPSRRATPAAKNRAKVGEVERRPSDRRPSYAHHRQTSIVQGAHTRNPSLLSPASSSPLSPLKTDPVPRTPILKKSPSASTLPSSIVNGNSVTRGLDGRKKVDRTQTTKVKRSHDAPTAVHGHVAAGASTVAESALQELFSSFVSEADRRIEHFVYMMEQNPKAHIERVCGPGADPAFDQLLWALGNISRLKPRSLIDSVVYWRKRKADHATEMHNELASDLAQATQRWTGRGASGPVTMPNSPEYHSKQHGVSLADRRSLVSVYILCRVLIEIISQTTLEALSGPDRSVSAAQRLEEVIYSQLELDPQMLFSSPIIHSNWIMRGQLLGALSALRFDGVTGRFIHDLRQAQKKLSVKNLADQRLTLQTSYLVKSMRWIKIRTQPEQAWDQSCVMLLQLARFFDEVHGRIMKYAYAELLEQLILPIAPLVTHEMMTPRWKEVCNTLQPKLTQMVSKTEHWPHVFPLHSTLFCVSTGENFAANWLPLINGLQPRLRDRSTRSHALKAICRVIWRYLFKQPDINAQVACRKLDEVIKLVFQTGRRSLVSTEPYIADPLIHLIRMIGYVHQELCFQSIIFPLMNSELFKGPEKDLKIEYLDPEKTVIAIRAFLAIIGDLEISKPPTFPVIFESDGLDPPSRAPAPHRRTRSQGFALSAGKTERLSQPIMVSKLNDITREKYDSFCKILGQLTIICDNTFGGQAVLDERLMTTTQTPKTPMAEAFSFNRRDDANASADGRQLYYNLLHVAVEALPRCLSPQLPISALVNLLCTGTAHVQPHIATTSAQSLKSIARQSHAQQVTIGFARFIFNFDDRYATVSDGSLLGPGHIESTLKLYVELLQIWINDIEQRIRKAKAEPAEGDDPTKHHLPLDLSSVWAHVDEIESHGLFFLCSPSRTVRAVAISVLRLVTKFDTALGKPTTRIINLLEQRSQQVIDVKNERLTLAERSILQKGIGKNSALVDLCSSDVSQDASLWYKIFPNFVKMCMVDCVHAVALTRGLVCQRLSHCHRTIEAIGLGQKMNQVPAETVVAQWRIHLIFACTTLTNVGGSHYIPPATPVNQHFRKSSKASTATQERIASATELFLRVVPFLEARHPSVRAAAVAGLGATNENLFPTLLDCLQPYVDKCNLDASERSAAHSGVVTSPRRSLQLDDLRTEITLLLSLTCSLLNQGKCSGDNKGLAFIADYTKQMNIYLNDMDLPNDISLQRLRKHFCMLVENFYNAIKIMNGPSRWMSFELRLAIFALMEPWCGFSPSPLQIHNSKNHVLGRPPSHERHVVSSAAEKNRIELQNVALSALAALCDGPMEDTTGPNKGMGFDLRRMLAWISAVFGSQSDGTHAIGRRALQNLIVNNLDQQILMTETMRMCYLARAPKALASYFEVVTTILTENTNTATPFWKILCVGLYTLGNETRDIRIKSNRLLRVLEERQERSSRLQDLDISVSDMTTAVYKSAQFEISCRLAKQHPELAFYVFSEFSAYFKELLPDHQRNMVSGMLPWIQTVELQLDPRGWATPLSHMLLANLFEITVKISINLHNEIQALWQALATGPYAGNVQVVLDFIFRLCLDKKEHKFVNYAKQIVVFLSKVPAGSRVIEYLLLQISPDTMVADNPPFPTPDTTGLPYVADLTTVIASGPRQHNLSLGQLCMSLLVDLVVSPVQLPAANVPTLLQMVLVQWDQHISIVQEQARELLVHLIHELVISKIEPGSTVPDKALIEDFIECVRRHDPKIMWSYNESEIQKPEKQGKVVSPAMIYVVEQVLKIFTIAYPSIREDWANVTMTWATSCAVRHVACRSFQVFRCIQTNLDQKKLEEMLARLSNTIADQEHPDFLVFSQEILTTLRSIIDGLSRMDVLRYPQLFWTTCACLGTTLEDEYLEALDMANVLTSKLDLGDPAVVKIVWESQPHRWDGKFKGIHELLYKGIRSSRTMTKSLAIMQRLIKLPSGEIVGGDERLLFTLLANLPRCLEQFEDAEPACLESVMALTEAAESQLLTDLSSCLESYAAHQYRTSTDFLIQILLATKNSFFPTYELRSLIFLLGIVNNQDDSIKTQTLKILQHLLPDTEILRPEFLTQGSDLISPLLRLLTTKHCPQVLDLLNAIIQKTSPSVQQQETRHLRLSLEGAYARKSMYGIPQESGWSVPNPGKLSSQTRANVHSVFWTLRQPCQEEEEAAAVAAVHTLPPHTPEVVPDTTMGELAIKVETLDEFFESTDEDEEEEEEFVFPGTMGMQFASFPPPTAGRGRGRGQEGMKRTIANVLSKLSLNQ
ncbi:hypothetical protein K470DRAFT_229802 [Piedraia hortae CBS 480.64]|uniref:Cell morphogenesis protein n=1 Tax=Piedraia hortae CBS 480.64 TaxID=1314780 RepID=A0A6A7C3X4_9PEZI|nr:hypothetical protein K470DRAFT_229802 [Piedraia hortae CBS 480.64]